MTIKQLLAVAAALVFSPYAAAQYREGQPSVLAQPEATDVDPSGAIIEKFRKRYGALRQPAIVLFWNRELTDVTARQVYQTQSIDGSRSLTASQTGDDENHQIDVQERTRQTKTTGQQSDDDNHREGLDEKSESILKSEFVSTMRSGGVTLLDRNLLLRLNAASASSAPDAQTNEIKALQGKAKYLLEVLLVRDAAAPAGFSFRCSLKDISSGAEVASLVTAARPPQRVPKGFVAVNGGAGFVRPAPLPTTIGDVGHALAVDLMEQLARSL